MLSGKVPDDRNCTRLVPNIFAVFVVIVVGGVNERCAMILSPLISYRKKACALRMFSKIHIPRYMAVFHVKTCMPYNNSLTGSYRYRSND